ncbi:hypothetical protein ASPZODRAFT_11442 [Penicilliopsis zonata CBS 506.65]|uniref:Helicase C-terminal domain-containing protein n=1 Tax=Penicilliopsis zonata CBS 506.65 TaxID=1073090 RepID=A0A1L9STW6_9EURO|nr:hypothetical protein ASPZODRAFT_11442 [Penicilliopsis zonata CBS 506.65]OJJ50576.1 hypothetical protein ASPZODRAFT_11442 [Penicilliopsis zonata CBS 506.65]
MPSRKRKNQPSASPLPAAKRRGTGRLSPQSDEKADEGTSSASPIPTFQVTPWTDRNIPEIVRSFPPSTKRQAKTQLAYHLPPIHKLEDIFKSITRQAVDLGFGKVLHHLESRRLRVVTVCSGTESPLLALEMVRDHLKASFGLSFEFHHLFSAEIEPFKQAYIERNFHPKYIFRDVTDLNNRVAYTAYGSLAKIPKQPDILIAGFSCVDFSNLNNKRKKELDESGQSGNTFLGVYRYVQTYRPPLVVLENVKGAPWASIAEHFGRIDYLAIHADVDTKAFYLPQTRERGYMFCVDTKRLKEHGIPESEMTGWSKILESFKRPASSPVGMFILDNDDQRLEQIENEMAGRALFSTRKAANWTKYQLRHQSYRAQEALGYRRPMSRWQDNGTCLLPDFAWKSWAQTMPERVWDTLDVNFLRKLQSGYDMNFKERHIELSQGLDREMDTRASGIVGCITPTGIPYITTRGGPLCGLEALSLQGLPLDRLLLSKESQRELQDLAGNAMSSTVVGSATLAALIIGHRILEKGKPQLGMKNSRASKQLALLQNHFEMTDFPLQPDKVDHFGLETLQAEAAKSARRCTCERQSTIRHGAIVQCRLCGHTACVSCCGNPTHSFERLPLLPRSEPLTFVKSLKEMLPMRLVLLDIFPSDFALFQRYTTSHISSGSWTKFLEAISRAVGDELRFSHVKRSESWIAVYKGRFSVLQFVISTERAEWLFFATPSESEPAASLMREILSKPIARMSPTGSLLHGHWEICGPISFKTGVAITGCGTQVASVESKCGLQKEHHAESKVWSHLSIEGVDQQLDELEVDIRGTYELLPDCGTAQSCLHKRVAAIEETKTAAAAAAAATSSSPSPDIYFFLDPTKLGEPGNDSFVFSLDHERISGYESRPVIAELSHEWRSSSLTDGQTRKINVYYRKWVKCPQAVLKPDDLCSQLRCCSLKPQKPIIVGDMPCRDSNITLLSFSAPAAMFQHLWEEGNWQVTNLLDSLTLLRDLSWLVQKAAALPGFQDWQQVTLSTEIGSSDTCTICVPQTPRIWWVRDKKNRLKAHEDPRDAAVYERQMKSRPPAFLVFRRVGEDGIGMLNMTLNVQTLLHQAYGHLVKPTDHSSACFFWRLVTNAPDLRNFVFPPLELSNNQKNGTSNQPQGFKKHRLRPEQLRSLEWMIKQEIEDIAPFQEEETEEALFPLMLWRAEAKVITQKIVRGGVLADDVGYGKTALILALIDSQDKKNGIISSQRPMDDGLIPTKATLIVVPPTIIEQWNSEIIKFLGTKYKVLVLKTVHKVGQTRIHDILEADIILASWQLFTSSTYYEKMELFTGVPNAPRKEGRNFDHWFNDSLRSLRTRVRTLVSGGPDTLIQSINLKAQPAEEGQTYDDQYRKDREEEASAEAMDIDENSDSDSSDEDDDQRIRASVDRYLLIRRAGTASRVKDNAGPRGGIGFTNEKKSEDYNETQSEKRLIELFSSQFGIEDGSGLPWSAVKTPLFHMFSYSRVVLDEFTYVDSQQLLPIWSLEARCRWVLSGTPPLNNFADVKTIAPFLGVHLGIDNDEAGCAQNSRTRSLHNDRSDAERFQSFHIPRSEAWHRHRHEVAQTFLNRFARKNVADIDEIPCIEHFALVPTSSAEKAVYLDLYQALMARNLQIRRGHIGIFSNSQSKRLDRIICNSESAEEVLLKRCSSFAYQEGKDAGKLEGCSCESIIFARTAHLEEIKEDLKEKLKAAAWLYRECGQTHAHFDKLWRSVSKNDFEDEEATAEISPLFDDAVENTLADDWMMFLRELDEEGEKVMKAKPTKKATRGGEDDKEEEEPQVSLPVRPKDADGLSRMLREMTTNLRTLVVEWIQGTRTLRLLSGILSLQTSVVLPYCASCGAQPMSFEELNILGSCGHILCAVCTEQTTQNEECQYPGCRGSGRYFNVFRASTLGRQDTDRTHVYGGSKLDALVELLRDMQRIPSDERAIVFVQFPAILSMVSTALELAGIKYTAISSTGSKSKDPAKQLKEFQTTSKVLVLNVGTESSAGLNLQIANHVIFFSPLLVKTAYDYESVMTQAIGRVRRYGQTRTVHVWHLLASMTIDVNILQDRRGKLLVKLDGQVCLVDEEEARERSCETFASPELVLDNSL